MRLRVTSDLICLEIGVDIYAAVDTLLKGRDVLSVLPKVFGKSLIFQVFVLAKSRASNLPNTL